VNAAKHPRTVYMRNRADRAQHLAHGFNNIEVAKKLRAEGKHEAADFHALCAGIDRRHAAAAIAKATT
jgi:hypothetical protein